MKKILLSIALALTVLSTTAALAVVSPGGTPTDKPGHEPKVSPKTADISTFAFAGAGVICLGGVFYCYKKASNA